MLKSLQAAFAAKLGVMTALILSIAGISSAQHITITNKADIESASYNFGDNASLTFTKQSCKVREIWMSVNNGDRWCTVVGKPGWPSGGEDANIQSPISVPIRSTYQAVTPSQKEEERNDTTLTVNDAFILMIADYPDAGYTYIFGDDYKCKDMVVFTMAGTEVVDRSAAAAKTAFSVRPCPNSLAVSLPDRSSANVSLLRIDGRFIAGALAENGRAVISTAAVHPGCYIVSVTGNGFNASQRITIQP
ncbi:MAG: hypothetical protein GF350_08035 [Chitinivibrionales bacterium]|nr:hypothetical protein [Chitinivibrionales bacterium]